MRYDTNLTPEQNAEQKRFVDYMKRVDHYIHSSCGLTSDDIEDWCYWDNFADGMSPRDCADEALLNAGFDIDFD